MKVTISVISLSLASVTSSTLSTAVTAQFRELEHIDRRISTFNLRPPDCFIPPAMGVLQIRAIWAPNAVSRVD